MFTADSTHRVSSLDNQFVYILDAIEAAENFVGNCHVITDFGLPKGTGWGCSPREIFG